ncbi:sarcosine oxidase subunit gamma family protein [Microtetraspora sp. NBRC 16547]|uniref:sarcosine oxidase subunit gamma n=1 Tax=Microtetraspora sp. NBRC 16547 TaxID=3030993 RepID=UPI0024A0CD2B|nr:sarcosine oxidase subunit gamma family protein [Microtetraspora sp. NBRC 16547]GLW99873.1 sarcosine oxidase subunit gamma [Microtetraspora sp. NBRC 16547]
MAECRSPAAAFADRFDAASKGGALRLAELPFLTQVDIRVDPASPAAKDIGAALGMPLPVAPGTTVISGDVTVAWLGPDEWLVIGPEGYRFDLLRKALGERHGSVVDVSAQRTTLLVAGPRARDLLAHGCALDLHPTVFGLGRCAQTMLARAQVVLLPRQDGLLVLVRSSFAAYLAEWLLDAATEYLAPRL